MSSTRRALGLAATAAVLAALALPLSAPAAYAAACGGAGASDFNGDGFDDAAVGDPNATIGGHAGAGAVQILYGTADGRVGEGARARIHQDSPGVTGVVENGDHFGTAVAVAHINDDSCLDLVVGVPNEDVLGVTDAGYVNVIFGDPAGLGHGQVGQQLYEDRALIPGVGEFADHFGSSVDARPAMGADASAVAVGTPHENVGATADAGAATMVMFAPGGTVASAKTLTESTAGIPGVAETGDRFGWAVALANVEGSTGRWDLVVGSPHEDAGALTDSGSVTIIEDVAEPVASFPAVTWSQDSPGVPGGAEAGDRFGWSVAYRTGGATRWIAIGVPYEDIGSSGSAVADAGAAQLLRSTGSDVTAGPSVNQDTASVIGVAEAGDRFGHAVALAGAGVTGGAVRLVVGVPYENIGAVVNAGAVQVFPVTDIASDVDYNQNTAGVVGAPQANDLMGLAVGNAGGTDEGVLLAGVPGEGAAGMVEVLPYGGGAPRAWVPGVDGVAGGGALQFGRSLAGRGE